MAASFFFYDLETSGLDPRSSRVMQFAGQRTDIGLNPIGEPINIFIKLAPDVLPSPDAIMVTGITPQQTLQDGVTEAEFLKLFYSEICVADTTFMGYNNVRFDDEFMRFLNYRNFYDPYEWQWQNGCSRWDLLDVVRMTRALRPDGIEWPVSPEGKPTNRLEFLTSLNKLEHRNAHDALSDVRATIAVAKLIRDKQPDLFKYLYDNRSKKKVAELVDAGSPFTYTSGRYASAYLHTTVAVRIAHHTQQDAALVYDLRFDPTLFCAMSVDEIIEAWKYTRDPDAVRLPVKTIKFNRCPAVAPLGVIKGEATQKRLQLDIATVEKHLAILKQHQPEFSEKILRAVAKMDSQREAAQTSIIESELTVDARLYDGFVGPQDKQTMRAVRAAKPESLLDWESALQDARLKSLLPLYKARNYPLSLSSEERANWDEFCRHQLFDGGNKSKFVAYFKRLEELAATAKTDEKRYLLEELQLYGQSIMPADVTD